jgi:hypothetical protein
MAKYVLLYRVADLYGCQVVGGMPAVFSYLPGYLGDVMNRHRCEVFMIYIVPWSAAR